MQQISEIHDFISEMTSNATEDELIFLLGDFNMFIQPMNLKTKQIIQSQNSHANQLKLNPKCT
jgi:hypothetical protein